MNRPRFSDLINKDFFPKNSIALDLGCHKGRESGKLIEIGFEVDAVDIDNLVDIKGPKFNFIQQDIKDFNIKKDSYNLVLAYYVLPFLKDKELIQKTIDSIKNGLKKGELAIITLFGDKHEWNGKRGKIAFFQ